jgi:D-3-phosphoglycerate dehydrogenase
VAEHAIGLMLALFNKLNSADIEIRNGKWLREENRGYELGGKTIGIIGYGHNGKALAKKLKGFDVNVLAHDILPKHEVENEDARMVEMEQIWEQADILSLHVPLTNLTKNLVNDAFLSRFKKNIWLFNTSRGEVVDLRALIENLDKGKVRGAGLDVLPIENLSAFKQQMPIEYEKLMQNKNVILTPHVAGWTHESYQKINEVLVKKILELGL